MGPKIVLGRDDPLVGVRLQEKVPAEPVPILVHARRGDGWRGEAIGEDVAPVPRSCEGHRDGAQPIARRRRDLQDRHIDHWILERYSHDRRVIGDWPVIRHDERVELVGRIASLAVVKDVMGDRKSTRLNSSHSQISYAVFCLKKKKKYEERQDQLSHVLAIWV